MESIMFRLATYLVSVAEQTGLNISWLETPKTGFVAMRPMPKLQDSGVPSYHCAKPMTN